MTNLKKLGIFCFLIALGTGISVLSRADEFDWAQLKGTVHFEKRSTVVPFSVCGEGPCYKPKRYWVMVVVADGVRYEWTKPFHIGQPGAPEYIEIGRALIRPGSRVRVQGHVENLGNGFGLLTEIGRIQVEMDAPAELMSESWRSQSLPWDEGPTGWLCHSVNRGAGPHFYVQVNYLGPSRSGGLYQMDVIADEGVEKPRKTILSIPTATSRTFGESIIYEGIAETGTAELGISDSSQGTFSRSRPGVLNFMETGDTGKAQSEKVGDEPDNENDSISREALISLVCDRIPDRGR